VNRLVGPPQKIVDDFITKPAYSIDENATIKQGKAKMKELNTDFLVVTRNNKPEYILREVDTVFLKPDDTIAKIAHQGKLDSAVVIESGSLWASTIPRLSENTLLIVVDTKAQPPQLRGAISTYEMNWKAQRRQQYRNW
jgi:CBS domain-containing protein